MSWVLPETASKSDLSRAALRAAYRLDEAAAVESVLAGAQVSPETSERITARAAALVAEARRRRHGKGGIDAFLNEFALSSEEGIALLCLAEALLRVPDTGTI